MSAGTESEFDAVVTVVRAWPNGVVELEVRGIGGRNDGKSRSKRYVDGEANEVLEALARVMVGAR